MSSSTTTRLEFVNNVLETAGLEPVTTSVPLAISADVSIGQSQLRRVIQISKSAFNELIRTSNWQWLWEFKHADSWSTDIATVNDMWKLKYITNGEETEGWTYVPIANRLQWTARAVQSYDSTANRPEFVVQWTDNTFRASPYPSTTETQERLHFAYYKTVTFPATDGAVFPMPERFVEALSHKVLYHVSLRIVKDQDEATFHQGQYEADIAALMTTDRGSDQINFAQFYG